MVDGDYLPCILGDFGAFMVDAHHPPGNAQIVSAALLEPSTMIDASFSWSKLVFLFPRATLLSSEAFAVAPLLECWAMKDGSTMSVTQRIV